MKIIFSLFFLFIFLSAKSQDGTDLQLAQYYYANGDFEKALPYCQKVYFKENSKFNFKRYYDCLVQTKKIKEAEKILKKQISANKEDFEYSILLADFYISQNELKTATKIFNELIEEYATNSFTVLDIYQAFKVANKTDLAFQTLEKARKTFKDKLPLHIQFAEMYKIQGELELMIQEYIN